MRCIKSLLVLVILIFVAGCEHSSGNRGDGSCPNGQCPVRSCKNGQCKVSDVRTFDHTVPADGQWHEVSSTRTIDPSEVPADGQWHVTKTTTYKSEGDGYLESCPDGTCFKNITGKAPTAKITIPAAFRFESK